MFGLGGLRRAPNAARDRYGAVNVDHVHAAVGAMHEGLIIDAVAVRDPDANIRGHVDHGIGPIIDAVAERGHDANILVPHMHGLQDVGHALEVLPVAPNFPPHHLGDHEPGNGLMPHAAGGGLDNFPHLDGINHGFFQPAYLPLAGGARYAGLDLGQVDHFDLEIYAPRVGDGLADVLNVGDQYGAQPGNPLMPNAGNVALGLVEPLVAQDPVRYDDALHLPGAHFDLRIDAPRAEHGLVGVLNVGDQYGAQLGDLLMLNARNLAPGLEQFPGVDQYDAQPGNPLMLDARNVALGLVEALVVPDPVGYDDALPLPGAQAGNMGLNVGDIPQVDRYDGIEYLPMNPMNAGRDGLRDAVPLGEGLGVVDMMGHQSLQLQERLLAPGLGDVPAFGVEADMIGNDLWTDPNLASLQEKEGYDRWLSLIRGNSVNPGSYPREIEADNFKRLYRGVSLPYGEGPVTVSAFGLFHRTHKGLESGAVATTCQIKDMDSGDFSVNLVRPAAGETGSEYFSFAYKGLNESVQGFVSRKEFDKVAGSIFKGKFIKTLFDKAADEVIKAEDERAAASAAAVNRFGADPADPTRRRARFVLECAEVVIKRLTEVVQEKFNTYTPPLTEDIYNFYETQIALREANQAVDPKFLEMELALGHLYAMNKTRNHLKEKYEQDLNLGQAIVDNLSGLVVSSTMLDSLPGYLKMKDSDNVFNGKMTDAAGESLAKGLYGICKAVRIGVDEITALQSKSEEQARAESMAKSQTVLREFCTPRISKEPFSQAEKEAFEERYGYKTGSGRIGFEHFRMLRVDGPDGVYFGNGVGLENSPSFSESDREDNVSVLFKGDCNRNAYVYLKNTPNCCVLVQKLDGGAVRIDFERVYIKDRSSPMGYTPVKLKDLEKSSVGAYGDVIKRSFKNTRICASSEYVTGVQSDNEGVKHDVVRVSKAIMYDGKVFDNYGLRGGVANIPATHYMPGVTDSETITRRLEDRTGVDGSRRAAFGFDDGEIVKNLAMRNIPELLERENLLIDRAIRSSDMEATGNVIALTPAALDKSGNRRDDTKINKWLGNRRSLWPIRYKGEDGVRGM
jgi:hypothetical protein